jgi:phosphatidylglycerophosphatase A
MKSRREVALFLATGFYIGKIPYAPGTFGSLIGLPLCFLLTGLTLLPAIFFAATFILLAAWIAGAAEKALGRKDPGAIVIDEVAGMVVALFGLPFTLTTAVLGFIGFRIIDIFKPFPIRILDKRLRGGVGVVADDVVAGIFANLILRLFLSLV